MLNLFQSDNPTVQQYAARALYSLADNEVKLAPLVLYFGQLCMLPFRNNIDVH